MGLLLSEAVMLAVGINAFEPYIYRLEKDYAEQRFIDWPTIVLANTVQATTISLFKLLPSGSQFEDGVRQFSILSVFKTFWRIVRFKHGSKELLDKRSIATMIRNIVDTHDVLEMMVNTKTPDEFCLHRDILGYYIANRTYAVQNHIDKPKAQQFYKNVQQTYWTKIQNSPLYTKAIERVKKGESVFYRSRRERVSGVCGENTDFVMGVLADLSTFVHSIPPSIWMKDLGSLYSDSEDNRDMVAIWLRVGNFYYAKVMEIVLNQTGYEKSFEILKYLERYESLFSQPETVDGHDTNDAVQ
ncbi:hypothetical protein JFN93_22600 [Geomonas sp. Red875]|uniref:Uncharacterized protein n=2 Tax=Geomesophilobacter sediminis TaxID=2798584 RepID=A0A8J7SD03_9BACT|nr:hypothetical protein [Geomesophilobacter sediminis]